MWRRAVVWAWFAFTSVGAAVLGAAGAALRTGKGRDVVVRAGIAALNDALDGTVTVGEVGGSFTGGLDARDVVVTDGGGTVLARLPRVEIRYRVRDLLEGRVVLGALVLTAPAFTLIQDTTGRYNFERVLRLNQPRSASGGGRPLIAFSDVQLLDASLTIRTLDGTGVSERRVDGLNARLTYARISSPLPGERPLRFDIITLAARISDPAIDVRNVRGRVDILGDSLALELSEVRLPGTVARASGSIRWPAHTLRFALDIAAGRVATEDLRWIMDDLAPGLSGHARATVRSGNGDVLAVRLEDLSLTAPRGGGSLHGTLGIVLGPRRHRTLQQTELVADNFDLEYVRPLLDTLPLAGRLSGTFVGEGPQDHLMVDVNWILRDSLVPGWPQSHIEGGGEIALGVPGDLVFRDFALRSASLDLGSVRRLVPVDLKGELDAAGTLNGPWRNLQFSGSLRQHDGTLPPTSARGLLRVDSRGDTLGVWADVSLDSLALDGLRSSYPQLSVAGSFGGDLTLSGFLDSLDMHVRLAGPGGDLTAQGTLLLLGARRGARALEVRFNRLNLHRFDPALPESRLQGVLQGQGALDDVAAPAAQGQLHLGRSEVAGASLDSLAARFVVRDRVFHLDTLTLWAPQLVSSAKGGLGLAGAATDSLVVLARTDSVGVIEPFARWLASRGAAPENPPSGAAEASVSIVGSATRFAVRGRVRTEVIQWGTLTLRHADATGRWQSDQRGLVQLDGAADSLLWGRLRFSGLEARVRGRRDSLGWFARTRLGQDVSWIAGGRLHTDSAGAIAQVDSMGVLLPSDAWFLTRGTRVVARDSFLQIDSTALVAANGGARLTLGGRVATTGAGSLSLSLEGVPLRDVWAGAQLDPSDVAGDLSGTATLVGSLQQPIIHGQAALQNVEYRGFRTPYVDGTFDYRDTRLAGQFDLWRAGQKVVGVTADLPLNLAVRGAPADRKLAGPLSIRVRADSVDLSFVEAMVPVARQTAGRLHADFGIAGTWQRPQLTGSLRVTDGAVTFPAIGVRHQDLYGRLSLVADTIRVDSLSVRSGDGTATVSGYVRLEELTRPRLNLHISAQGFRVMDVRDYLGFTAAGDLELRGPVYGATLTGRGTVTRGVLYFTDLITKQVISLEDTRYADIIDTSLVRRQGLREEFENRFLDSLRIDSLVLTMGSDVWMRSSEANIQLNGQLTVGKVADRYRLDGALETPRGTYRLPLTTSVTSEFTVARGQLQYFGTPDLNAAVDIDARHVVRRRDQNVTVTVHIGGSLYTPRLTLSSDIRPPVSEAELISYLMFGTPSVEAFAEGRNRELLGTAFSRLAGVLSGQLERSLITDFGIPLDFVQIRPGNVLQSGGSPLSGTEISIGKQVSLFGAPTFLTYSPRICGQGAGLSGLSAELHLSRQWLAALSHDPVGPCAGLISQTGTALHYQWGLDVFWERVY